MGYCGSGPAFCGNGCHLGHCLLGAETTDGTCGPTFEDFTCGSWPEGSCRSSAGFCGSTEPFCGSGCISDPYDNLTNNSVPSDDVWIDPSILGNCKSIHLLHTAMCVHLTADDVVSHSHYYLSAAYHFSRSRVVNDSGNDS